MDKRSNRITLSEGLDQIYEFCNQLIMRKRLIFDAIRCGNDHPIQAAVYFAAAGKLAAADEMHEIVLEESRIRDRIFQEVKKMEDLQERLRGLQRSVGEGIHDDI